MKRVLVAMLALGMCVADFAWQTAWAIKAPPRPKTDKNQAEPDPSGKTEQQLLIERISGVIPDETSDGLAKAKKKPRIDYSASVAFASQYVFRGISLSDEEFAVQGSLNALTPGGYYLGAFASSVDFNDGDQTDAELDFYTGMLGKITDRLGYNLDLTYSTFPGAPSRFNFDNVEVGGFLEYAISRYFIHGGLVFSPDFFANSGTAIYYDSNVDISLINDFTLKLHAGFQELEKNDRFGTEDYADWLIGLHKDFEGFNASVSFIDTNLSREECFGGQTVCEERVVFLIGRGL